MKTIGGHSCSKFSESFRIKITTEYLNSNQGYAQITKKHELKNLETPRSATMLKVIYYNCTVKL